MSLPFDWLDLPTKNIKQFLDMGRSEIEPFLLKYFSEIKGDRHSDMTWFPHDSFDPFEGVVDKYIKRFERLFDLFNDSSKTLIFLTIIDAVDEKINFPALSELRQFIMRRKTNASCVFISINEFDYDRESGNEDFFQAINFHIKRDEQDEQFKKFEADIATKISTHEWTKQYFL